MPAMTETEMPRARILSVACNLHSAPDPAGCTRCHDAREINLRLDHEHGTCGGIGWCGWCTPPNWKPGP